MANNRMHKQPYLWPVGLGGMVAPERVVAVARSDSAPIRRAVRQARLEGRLIDLTYGEPCKWVLYLDSGHLALASDPMPVTAVDDNDEFIPYHPQSD
jgi:extracellular matrix regulatory protein A